MLWSGRSFLQNKEHPLISCGVERLPGIMSVFSEEPTRIKKTEVASPFFCQKKQEKEKKQERKKQDLPETNEGF